MCHKKANKPSRVINLSPNGRKERGEVKAFISHLSYSIHSIAGRPIDDPIAYTIEQEAID
jgi:hypothetical protein